MSASVRGEVIDIALGHVVVEAGGAALRSARLGGDPP